MKNSNNIENHLSQERMRQYLNDALSNSEAHQVERHLLDCDLCADALEGMKLLSPSEMENDVALLQQRLSSKIRKREKPMLWIAAAAVGLFILISGSLFIFIGENYLFPPKSLAEIQKEEPLKESEKSSATDSTETDENKAPERENLAGKEVQRNKTETTQEEITPTPSEISSPSETEVLTDVMEDQEMEEKEIEELQIAENKTNDEGPLKTLAAPAAKQSVSDAASGMEMSKKRELSDAANTRILTGVVKETNGLPLSGVQISLPGSKATAITNENGKYTIGFSEKWVEAIVAEHIGKSSISVEIPGGDTLNIVLAEKDPEPESFFMLEQNIQKAMPSGGWEAYTNYLKDYGNSRKFKVKFTVQPDGTLTDIRLSDEKDPDCLHKIRQIVKSGPKWTPSNHKGVPIAEEVEIEISCP